MSIRLFSIAVLLTFSQAVLAAHEGREHTVPLFMGIDDEHNRQGFIRVINHSDAAGTVEIHGYDDAGMEFGPVELTMAPRQTVQFNSDHLEGGQSHDDLNGSLGNGMGFWRLVLSSDTLDIEPLAYFRNRDTGFLSSIHDVVSESAMTHRVGIFNPTNPNQVSQLRVINLGDATASVMVTGLDDEGVASPGSVSLSVPARGAILKSAAELEEEGLGDGTGKWSLNVTADQPVQVMSLMALPGGYLSNLSGARRDYRGAAGLWQVRFEDGMGGDGIIVLLPDNRLYAWLPETADLTRIARGTYGSEGAMVSGEGVVYESGKQEVDGVTPVGGADDVTLTAAYRSGDWIRGSYTVAGESERMFHGWAFTGFERGGSGAEIMGTWSPMMGDDADLPATLTVDADGMFEGVLMVDAGTFGELDCAFTATLSPVNPAFNAYDASPTINCQLIVLGGEANPDQVEMFMGVMDAPDGPGMSDRAIIFSMLPLEANEIGLGAVYERTQ